MFTLYRPTFLVLSFCLFDLEVLLKVIAIRFDVMAHDYFISIKSEASDNGIEQQPTPYFLLLPSRRYSSREETKDMTRGMDD